MKTNFEAKIEAQKKKGVKEKKLKNAISVRRRHAAILVVPFFKKNIYLLSTYCSNNVQHRLFLCYCHFALRGKRVQYYAATRQANPEYAQESTFFVCNFCIRIVFIDFSVKNVTFRRRKSMFFFKKKITVLKEKNFLLFFLKKKKNLKKRTF